MPVGSQITEIADLADQHVAVEWGSMGDADVRQIQRETVPSLQRLPFSTPDEALAALLAGDAGALVIDGVTLRLAQGRGAAIQAIGAPLEAIPTSSRCRSRHTGYTPSSKKRSPPCAKTARWPGWKKVVRGSRRSPCPTIPVEYCWKNQEVENGRTRRPTGAATRIFEALHPGAQAPVGAVALQPGKPRLLRSQRRATSAAPRTTPAR
ncbi:MAG: hypothetical protein R2873_01760 [Caldilineaceae bacterium]